MRYIKFFVAACLLFAVAVHAADVKVMSYNIRNCKGMDRMINYQRVADVINAQQPDVLMLQEVDSATMRSSGVVVVDTLASLCNMYGTFSAAINFEGGKYGIGMLSREKPLGVTRYALPGREEERTLLVVEFKDYVMASTHLSLTEEDRDASMPILLEAASRFNKPFFIAGDFNAEPTEASITQFVKHFGIFGDAAVKTFPADNPNIKIDYIAIYGNEAAERVQSLDYNVINEPMASDHRPIITTVRIK